MRRGALGLLVVYCVLTVVPYDAAQAGPEATLPSLGRPEDVAVQNAINRQNYDLANKAVTTRLQATTLLIGGTTATVTGMRAEAGAVVLVNTTGGAVSNVIGHVNFLQAFTTAPLVVAQHVGVNGAETGYPPTSDVTGVGTKIFHITTTGMDAQVFDTAGVASILNGQRNWIAWQAWGR